MSPKTGAAVTERHTERSGWDEDIVRVLRIETSLGWWKLGTLMRHLTLELVHL